MSITIQNIEGNAVDNAPTRIKWYVTEEGVNLYDLFKAGIGFCQAHTRYAGGRKWTEQEWYDALESALPPEFVAKLDEEAHHRQGR
jgi:hypothetical protein